MTVLVVRPAPSCHELVDTLTQAGILALAAPLLTFSKGSELHILPDTLALLPPSSVVVAVSPRAVEYACNEMENQSHSWRQDLRYLAIGQKTAQIWESRAGIKATFPRSETSEGLLNINSFLASQGLNVVILRGNGGRALLGEILAENGAKIRYLEAYQRHWNADSPNTLVKQWRSEGVDTLVITSGEQLSYLCKIIPTKDHQWLKECHILVPSKRIYNQAISLCFTTINCIDSASNFALFRALHEMHKSGQSDDKKK